MDTCFPTAAFTAAHAKNSLSGMHVFRTRVQFSSCAVNKALGLELGMAERRGSAVDTIGLVTSK